LASILNIESEQRAKDPEVVVACARKIVHVYVKPLLGSERFTLRAILTGDYKLV